MDGHWNVHLPMFYHLEWPWPGWWESPPTLCAELQLSGTILIKNTSSREDVTLCTTFRIWHAHFRSQGKPAVFQFINFWVRNQLLFFDEPLWIVQNQVLMSAWNSAAADRLSDGADRWTLRCSVMQSWRASPCSETFVPSAKQWPVGACRPWDFCWSGEQILYCPVGHCRICGCLAPCVVHQETPFRRQVSLKWRKRHFDIWTSRPSGLKAFQTIWPCGLNLFCNNWISCGFLQSSWNQSRFIPGMPKVQGLREECFWSRFKKSQFSCSDGL